MTTVHLTVGIAVCALFLAAGLWGAWRWWRVRPSAAFWKLLRAAQVALLAQVLLGGILLLGRHTPGRLHVLYGLLPVAVSFIAEQLRIGAAESVLAARGHTSAAAVGELDERDQRSVVLAVVRREIGVMTLAALVCFGLVIRAAFTS
ncbi:MAG TPA: hypothetical protein VHE14_01315 [Solirubrobacteraceae bacterium]|nr:hypothetical protein [Solirubrobacteraceae bacterium]